MYPFPEKPIHRAVRPPHFLVGSQGLFCQLLGAEAPFLLWNPAQWLGMWSARKNSPTNELQNPQSSAMRPVPLVQNILGQCHSLGSLFLAFQRKIFPWGPEAALKQEHQTGDWWPVFWEIGPTRPISPHAILHLPGYLSLTCLSKT